VIYKALLHNYEDIRITGNIVLAKKGDWGGCAEESRRQENWSAIDQVGIGEKGRQGNHQGSDQNIQKIEDMTGYFPQESALTSASYKNNNVCIGIIKSTKGASGGFIQSGRMWQGYTPRQARRPYSWVGIKQNRLVPCAKR